MVGDKCLHLDEADRYGGHITSFNLEQYLAYVDSKLSDTSKHEDHCESFKVLKPFDKSAYADLKAFKSFSRNFNIDLVPKLLFSKSTSVDLLLDSGTAHYLEFQSVPHNYFFSSQNNNAFVQIPFSKSEIFTNSSLSLKEKR